MADMLIISAVIDFVSQYTALTDCGESVALWAAAVSGFISCPARSSAIPSLFGSYLKDDKVSTKSCRWRRHPAPAHRVVPEFYLKKWRMITDLVPDKFHSHIGGIGATKQYFSRLNLKPWDRIIDIGCGYGGVLITAAQSYGCDGVGLDLVPERISVAQDAATLAGVGGKVTFLNEDFIDWEPPYPIPFDAAAVFDVMIHVEDKEKFIAKLSSILKRQGRAFVADYFASSRVAPGGGHIFDEPALYPPLEIAQFEELLNKSGLYIMSEDDLSPVALEETVRLIDVIENLRDELSSRYTGRCVSETMPLLEDWKHVLAAGCISYRALLLGKA